MTIRKGMIKRCHNVNSKSYLHYGGRGIAVCEDWLNSFQLFYEWAMSNGYQQNLSIDRIDNDKGYSPENCRWITMKQQCRNTRQNVMLSYNGETMCVTDWATKLGLSRFTLYGRIRKGWPIKDVLAAPYGGKKHE